MRAHLGWADAVTLTGVPDEPVVVDRRRVTIPARDGYHAAQHAAPEDREMVLQEAADKLELAATDAMAELTSELDIEAGGVVTSREVLLRIPIDRVLASSTLLHTASGAMYQRALHQAFENLGLVVATISFDDAQTHPAWEVVNGLGKVVGPPWRKDHKWAATAAWVAAERAERAELAHPPDV